MSESAERTLKFLGYEDLGGEYWKPPLVITEPFDISKYELEHYSLNCKLIDNEISIDFGEYFDSRITKKDAVAFAKHFKLI